MGRAFDGSYAEYTSAPAAHVLPAETSLAWKTLGALPEMLQTVHGSHFQGLEIGGAKNLLIRGGSSSIGMMAAVIAAEEGLHVVATTRDPAKTSKLHQAQVSEVLIDDGLVANAARVLVPGGFGRVLELVGTRTLLDQNQATGKIVVLP